MPPKRKPPLARAADVVRKLMAMPRARQLFNAPVDTSAPGLRDYGRVVPHPLDLGSIAAALAEAEAAQWEAGSGEYQSAEHVLRALHRVWRNCLAYNTRPHEAAIAEAAWEMAAATAELWRKAGLPGAAPPPGAPPLEGAVSPLYDAFRALLAPDPQPLTFQPLYAAFRALLALTCAGAGTVANGLSPSRALACARAARGCGKRARARACTHAVCSRHSLLLSRSRSSLLSPPRSASPKVAAAAVRCTDTSAVAGYLTGTSHSAL